MNAISREYVEKIHAALFEQAGEIVAKEEHESLVFGFPAEGDEPVPKIIGMYPLTDASKRFLPLLLQDMAKKIGIAVHVCEAWAVERTKDQVKDENDPLEGVRVSECEDKIEVVIMIFQGEGWRAFANHKIVLIEGKRTLQEAKLEFEGAKHQFSGSLMGRKGTVQ